MTKKIYASILNADFSRLGDQIAAAEEGGVDGIHVDVMDGHFVPNLSLGPQIVEAVRSCTALTVDVHLMIERPERFLTAFVEAGADHVTVHYEATPHVAVALDTIHQLGATAGLALNPSTPLAQAAESIEEIEMLMLMTVNPGLGGQAIIPRTIEKVARARAWLDDLGSNVALQVDGGVKASNVRALDDAGASHFVIGTSIFHGHHGPAENARTLRHLLCGGAARERSD